MSETIIGLLAFGSLVCLSVSSLLYMLGGRSGKWKRRFGASALLATTNHVISMLRGLFSPFQLITYGTLAIGFSLGYGADIEWKKWVKRTIYAISNIASGLVYCYTLGGNAWLILPAHVGVGLWSIWLGVKNPVEAAAEETFVCTVPNLGFIMYPYIVVK